MKAKRLIPSVFVCAVALAACSPGKNAGGCASVIGAPQMVYPSPGATAVPTTIGQIFLSYDVRGMTLNVFGSQLITGVPVQVAPSPYPSSVPSPNPGQQYGVAHISTLSPASTYTVSAIIPQCTGNNTATVIGSFTTQ